ncbi:hypothetical protein OROHE_020720 [Orobanche hederae]
MCRGCWAIGTGWPARFRPPAAGDLSGQLDTPVLGWSESFDRRQMVI